MWWKGVITGQNWKSPDHLEYLQLQVCCSEVTCWISLIWRRFIPSSKQISFYRQCTPASVGEESTHPLLLVEEQVHTCVNATGMHEEWKNCTSVHIPLEARISNAESNIPKEEPSSIEDRDSQIFLEPKGVRFVLEPTPIQSN